MEDKHIADALKKAVDRITDEAEMLCRVTHGDLAPDDGPQPETVAQHDAYKSVLEIIVSELEQAYRDHGPGVIDVH